MAVSKKDYNMDMANFNGKTDQLTKGNTEMVFEKAKDNISTLTIIPSQEECGTMES